MSVVLYNNLHFYLTGSTNFILLSETLVHKNQSDGILSLIRAEFFNICLMSAQVHPRPFAPPVSKKGLRLHKQEITELLT